MTKQRSEVFERASAFVDIEDATAAVQEGVSAILVASRGIRTEEERRGLLFIATELDDALSRLSSVLADTKGTLCA